MYRIMVEHHFDAAHFLRGYKGKCEALHGHRFRVVVMVRADSLDETGMAFDFSVLKGHLREVLARFDHNCLNDTSPFDKLNPTSENIAKVIAGEINPRLAEFAVTLSCVEVWESPQSGVSYYPD